MVYSYGGTHYSPNFSEDHTVYASNVEPEIWGFTPPESGSVNWSLQFAKSLSDSFPLTSSVESALTVSSGKKHYSLGGTITFQLDADANGAVPIQMVMEDFVTYDYATQTFTNVTRTSPHSFGGEAHFVPQYGEEGVLVFLDGKNPLDRNVASLDLADLGVIQVYDIHTDTFHMQAATNAPTGRYSFCSVGASNVNSSSYEMYVYSLLRPVSPSLTSMLSVFNIWQFYLWRRRGRGQLCCSCHPQQSLHPNPPIIQLARSTLISQHLA